MLRVIIVLLNLITQPVLFLSKFNSKNMQGNFYMYVEF